MKLSEPAKQLKQRIENLLQDQRDDLRLRDHLVGMQERRVLPGLTWYWGPELYRRNRVVFREFITTNFSQFIQESTVWAWTPVKWSDHAPRLQAWLDDARRHHDTYLARRLLLWKFSKQPWGLDSAAWCRELKEQYLAVDGPAAQARVLELYDDGFVLDEPTALALYTNNRASAGFILKHLPHSSTWWGTERRALWRSLMLAAEQGGDRELADTLYRRQVDVKQWQRDVAALALTVEDPAQLNDMLLKRHPEGWSLNLVDGVVKLLETRGRDVLPYVRAKLDQTAGTYYSNPAALLQLARTRGWWDLWAAVLRISTNAKQYNEAIKGLLASRDVTEAQRVERLRALAGVSSEFNWPGFGFARVHGLDDTVAADLYRRYPKLAYDVFKPNLAPRWWQGMPLLLAAAQGAGDDQMVDLLASRYVTMVNYEVVGGVNTNPNLKTVNQLAVDYQALRTRDEAEFARRAADVLTRIPSQVTFLYDQMLRTNDLARLLFVRSFSAYLCVPEAVRDLVEGSNIHVQLLGYRVLAQPDARAQKLAVELLDLLLPALLRPLHRKTRLAAFAALANAARHDLGAAGRILRRARQALRLPDVKYPKEQLVGLIGAALHAWPALWSPRERPVIYRLQEGPA